MLGSVRVDALIIGRRDRDAAVYAAGPDYRTPARQNRRRAGIGSAVVALVPAIHSHHSPVRWLCLLMFLVASACPSRARAAEPGEELTIYVLTMQPGELVFEKFGHNAVWVHDEYAPLAYQDV